MYAITRTPRKALALLLGALLLASCGVTNPDDAPWQNVADFSWPIAKGAAMKYRTIVDADIIDSRVQVDLADTSDPLQSSTAYYNGHPMYVMHVTEVRDIVKDSILQNPPNSRHVHFLPLQDTLIVRRDEIGEAYALVAPIVKGHRWVAAYENGLNGGDTVWVAEIIELFSHRKVEGITYENVVAVKYHRPKRVNNSDDIEWIRFYAQGIGEIMTVKNVYPSESTLSDPVPQQKEKKVLLESTN